ncbi:MAG: PIN domain-containing protein [Pseudomonadota bacterium]
MPNTLISIVILLSCAVAGGAAGYQWSSAGRWWPVISGMSALVVGGPLLALLRHLRKSDPWSILGGMVGLLAGALFCRLFFGGAAEHTANQGFFQISYFLTQTIACLFGLYLGSWKAGELRRLAEKDAARLVRTIGVLDTSVIIDGRIADVVETGFVSGDLIIPQFVLHELQLIADSADANRRTRGRRGLDILNKIQKQSYVNILIDETDYPAVKEVDQKLINLAKHYGCAILTNDFNLNKVAEVQSIRVLNINQLANALKPIVLPGETLRVQVIKDGKEPSQGVAYLDDGTMVVVDNGRRVMGRTVEITVTSVLQTTAGRMIFAVLRG